MASQLNRQGLFTRPLVNPDENRIHLSGAPKMEGYNDVWAAGVRTRMSNPDHGGQFGFSPDFSTWVHAHPHVSRNIIPVLVEAPLGMRALPNAEKWIASLRALVEITPKSISGLSYRLDVSTGEFDFGGGGQAMDVVTNVKESRPEIEFVWQERYGMPISRFLGCWIRYLIMDPNTKNATINTIPDHYLNDLMADQYAMTMLFIEPDPLHRSVVQSWLVTNMFPKTTGDNNAKRDMANDMEMRELSIPFSGLSLYSAGVDDFAQWYLEEVHIVGADPHARTAFLDGISDFVRGVGIGQKYESTVEDIAPLNRILTPNHLAGNGSGGKGSLYGNGDNAQVTPATEFQAAAQRGRRLGGPPAP